ncbi:MAG: cobaltochelatase subunit CobT [Micavibrio sp.]|nr:cobaltochelatase subunit CobT [Micavibrio sp.]
MSAKDKKRLENFKDGLSATIRAFAHKKDVSVSFKEQDRQDRPRLSDKRYRNALNANVALPHSKKLSADEKSFIRGSADAEGLYLGLHDKVFHTRNRPDDETAGAIYDALEQARYESLGARQMRGVAKNLNEILKAHCLKQGYNKDVLRETTNDADAFYTLARLAFTNNSEMHEADGLVKAWQPHLNKLSNQISLDKLSDTLSSQKDFSRFSKSFLSSLGYLPDDDALPHSETNDKDATEQDDEGKDSADPSRDEESTEKEHKGQDQPQESSDDTEASQDEAEAGLEDSNQEYAAQEDADSHGDAATEKYRPANPSGPIQPSYKIYTTEFDEVIKAQELADPYELQRLRQLLDKQMGGLQSVVSKLATRLQRKLLAQQQRHWVFDLEEGTLDTARLARMVANPSLPMTFKQEEQSEFKDTVVTLLLDNSGSMRGRPIATAALCADILARTLEKCQVKVEVLGFTTRAWKGGKSRDLWQHNGRPTEPGRLNDLRHIIYKSANQPWRRVKNNLALMLKEGLLKENIDGEALAWAYNRLARRAEQRKIMIVISDGAPVDDSTLSVNPANILELDLQHVIARVEQHPDIELAAIGIGHDVSRHYRNAIKINDVSDLAEALIEQLEDLFSE